MSYLESKKVNGLMIDYLTAVKAHVRSVVMNLK